MSDPCQSICNYWSVLYCTVWRKFFLQWWRVILSSSYMQKRECKCPFKIVNSILTKSCYMYAALTVSTCYTWSWTVYAVLCTRVEEIHTCLWSAKNRLSVAETNILFMYVWISNHLPTTKGKINPGMKTGASVLSKYEYDMGISWSNNILTPDNSMRLNW